MSDQDCNWWSCHCLSFTPIPAEPSFCTCGHKYNDGGANLILPHGGGVGRAVPTKNELDRPGVA